MSVAGKEKINWKINWKLEKFHEDISHFQGREDEFHKLFKPYEVIEVPGNLLLNEGIDEMERLITGTGSPTAFNNTNARIGVGNGTAAADATQTGLQGASTAFAGMDAGYPTVGTQKMTFRASFGAGAANFAWEEWTIDNGATAAKNMNRKVQALGTKAGGTWVATAEVTLA